MNSEPALLILDDGTVFAGTAHGARGQTIGEITITTAATGYQESLADGTNAAAIVLMTSPHVGNVGVNDSDAGTPVAAGLIVRDPARVASNWQATRTLEDELTTFGVVGISQIDTRALSRHIRSRGGAVVGGVFSGGALPRIPGEHGHAELATAVRAYAVPTAAELIASVSTGGTSVQGSGVPGTGGAPAAGSIAVLDLGLAAEATRAFSRRGFTVTTFGPRTTAEELVGAGADAIVVSGGPGDPADPSLAGLTATVTEILDSGAAILGLGLGHQLIARALGFDTVRLANPHGGVNHPVQNLATGKVDITTHSHAYTVAIGADSLEAALAGEPIPAPAGGHVRVTHVNLNDRTVEGIRGVERPIFGLQFHPEPAAGTSDAAADLDVFVSILKDA